jgi:hypothetical protein
MKTRTSAATRPNGLAALLNRSSESTARYLFQNEWDSGVYFADKAFTVS